MYTALAKKNMAVRSTALAALLACVLQLSPGPSLYVECTSTPPTPGAASGSFTDSLAVMQANYLAWVQEVDVKSKKTAARGDDSSISAASSKEVVITVAKFGKADFSTVQAAVDAVPSNNTKRVIIQIAAATYTEKVIIPTDKPYISFLGAGAAITTIAWNDTASSTGTTFNSASVAVNSDFFIARDISFKNFAPEPLPGSDGEQAVAVRVSGDKAAFYSCSFYGAQDTLYDHEGRHYFSNCFIQGSIDFIFGHGLSYYEGCELHCIARSITGFLTAQNRASPKDNNGFAFVRCKITGSGMIYLGRVWGAYSRVVFLLSYMDNIITPAGWQDFGDSHNQKTAFYGEYLCYGPGAKSQSRAAWSYQLTAFQAAPFMSLNFIDGKTWLRD